MILDAATITAGLAALLLLLGGAASGGSPGSAWRQWTRRLAPPMIAALCAPYLLLAEGARWGGAAVFLLASLIPVAMNRIETAIRHNYSGTQEKQEA